MKATTARKNWNYCACRYPNAARKGYFLSKFIDGVLSAAITLAALTALLFILTAL